MIQVFFLGVAVGVIVTIVVTIILLGKSHFLK